jgi:hypothetical protein
VDDDPLKRNGCVWSQADAIINDLSKLNPM